MKVSLLCLMVILGVMSLASPGSTTFLVGNLLHHVLKDKLSIVKHPYHDQQKRPEPPVNPEPIPYKKPIFETPKEPRVPTGYTKPAFETPQVPRVPTGYNKPVSEIPKEPQETAGSFEWPSRNFYKFLLLSSGVFTNEDQVNTDKERGIPRPHDSVTIVQKPIYIGSMGDKITFFYQKAINGHVIRNQILELYEDYFGILHVQAYNITYLNYHDPYDRHDTDYSDISFYKLPLEGLFYSIDENVYFGSIPECEGGSSREIANYAVVNTCYSMSFNLGSSILPETKLSLPYLSFKDYSFSLLPHMINHKEAESYSPCFYQ